MRSVFCFTVILCLIVGYEAKKKYILYNSQVSWSEAQALCKSMGMRMAEIYDYNDNERAFQVLTKYNTDMNRDWEGVWIGATDVHAEAKFIWIDSGLPVIYSDFASGNPNNDGDEDCVAITKMPHGRVQWNDDKCKASHKFLCEKI